MDDSLQEEGGVAAVSEADATLLKPGKISWVCLVNLFIASTYRKCHHSKFRQNTLTSHLKESSINDKWNIDGNRILSESWSKPT